MVLIILSKSQQLFLLPINLERCNLRINDLRVLYDLQHLILPSHNTYADGIIKEETDNENRARHIAPNDNSSIWRVEAGLMMMVSRSSLTTQTMRDPVNNDEGGWGLGGREGRGKGGGTQTGFYVKNSNGMFRWKYYE